MADLKNIALTVESTHAASSIKRWTGVTEQMHVIRLGFAYAVKHHLDLTPVGTRGGSNYDTGGLDHDGLMARTVGIYYPDPSVREEPYRAVEILMTKGLNLLQEHHDEGLVGCLADVLRSAPPASEEPTGF